MGTSHTPTKPSVHVINVVHHPHIPLFFTCKPFIVLKSDDLVRQLES